MKSIRQFLTIGVGLLLTITILNVFSIPTHADLPLRPTPTPVPAQKSTAPQGAHIVLQTQAGVWTVVQWQDVNGDWQNVDGWRGTAIDGTVSWWVAQKDFGTGPFRWAVYQSDGGALISASDSFHLPTSVNETITIIVP